MDESAGWEGKVSFLCRMCIRLPIVQVLLLWMLAT